jgi:hypothetical protein
MSIEAGKSTSLKSPQVVPNMVEELDELEGDEGVSDFSNKI